MSSYVQTTFFTPKDTLPTTNPAKTIFGAAYDVEFGNIAAAINSKPDNTTSASFLSLTVGTPTGGNLGTGSINAQSIFVNNVAVALAGSGVTSVTGTANQITASPTTGAVVVGLPQNVIIPTPASGTALAVTAANSANAILITGGATAGQSFGARILAGTTAADIALEVSNKAGSVDFLNLFGDGHGSIGPSGILGLSWTANGNITAAASSSGTTLTVNGIAGGQVAQFSGPSGTTGVIIAIGALSTDATLRVLNATASANYFEIFGDGHGFITPLTAGGLSWTVGGNFSFAAPSSGTTLALTAVAAGIPLSVTDGTTSGQIILSASMQVGASSAHPLSFYTNNATRVTISAAGGVFTVGATGGDQGLGTLNATGLFVNGVDARAAGSLTGATLNATVVNSSLTSVGTLTNLTVSGTITNAGIATTGSFTGTLATGGTTTPTTTCKYTKVGNSVTLRIAAVTYVSNATGMTLTGLPAAIQPATGVFTTASASITNNGNAQAGSASISGGTMTFTTGVAGSFSTTGFTGSGTKGFLTDTVFCWDIN